MKLSNHQKGIIFILLSTLFFTLTSVATKAIPHIPSFQRAFFMNMIATFFMLTKITPNAKKEITGNIKLLSLRATLGFISTITYFYALGALPLADATLLNKTSPFFVTFFSIVWLKERVKPMQLTAMVIALIGAILVINPSFDVTIVPTLIAIISGASAGAAYTTVRKLSHAVNPKNIVFYFMLFSTIIGIPPMLIQGIVMPNAFDWVMMFTLAIGICLGQVFLSLAYKHEEASKISIYSFTQIIMGAFFGLVLFAEIPSLTTLLGGAVILFSGYLNYRATK